MAARCRALDWAATPLGPVDRWPPALRTAAALAVAAGFPTVLLWGPELVQVYNDGYRAITGAKHPAGLGQPTRECWPEVWHVNAPVYERVHAGETVRVEDARFPIARSGALEDAWFTLAYSPVRDDAGAVGGVLVTVVETTAHVIGRAAQAERERLEGRLHGALLDATLLLDQMSDAYLVMDGAVTLACARDPRPGGDASVVVTVTDTGRGIAPDTLERVFEPFVQVDTRLTRTEEGIGLGLAISLDLARGMGGDLTAESTLGAGSTFTLTLPAA